MKQVCSPSIPAITCVRQRLVVTASSRFPHCRNTPGGEGQRKLLPIHRFGQTGLRTDVTQMPPEIGRHHRTHHDDRERRQPLLDLPQRFCSVHSRHHHITQHRIHMSMSEDIQGFQARRSRDCHALPESNRVAQRFPNIRIIVDDQNAWLAS